MILPEILQMRTIVSGIFLLAVFYPIFLFAESAPYSASFGGRLEESHGDANIGPTYRYYLGSKISTEIFALTDFSNGIEFYGFLQYGEGIPGIPANFRWIAGAGAHAGTWKGYHDSFVAGFDGMLGLEYTFDKHPLSLSLDWHPLVNIITEKKNDRFWPQKFGLSARYVIGSSR